MSESNELLAALAAALDQALHPRLVDAILLFVGLTANAISIRRRDPVLGDLAVHFPRAGYRLRKL